MKKTRSLKQLLNSQDRNFTADEKKILEKFFNEASEKAEVLSKTRVLEPHRGSWKNSKKNTDRSYDEEDESCLSTFI